MEKENGFHIGICMAGAVSAGAYSAGVMDYLLEALEAWEVRKKSGAENTPSHPLTISVIGGASAGGMTGIITTALFSKEHKPIREPLAQLMQERPENILYHSWVDMLGEDMFRQMLQTDDIENEEELASLLNSGFIDTIANRALRMSDEEPRSLPDYVHPKLKVFTTLTNLEGLHYNIGFNSGSYRKKYNMTVHNDYACFTLDGSSETTGWMPLNFETGLNAAIARDAAMATGAFPLGLRSRMVRRESRYVNELQWHSEITGKFPLQQDYYATQNVDGGMINNEPFEKVRSVLQQFTGEEKEEFENEERFRSTVLMIDPFPSNEPRPFDPAPGLMSTIGKTFGAMLAQMRAKPIALASALDENCPSQFLIAPSRRINTPEGELDLAGDEAIACGALGGFSGFLSKEFRIHDYFLGRFNCEIFLRDYFTISEKAVQNHPIFSKGYEGVDKTVFRTKDGRYPIVPIFSERKPQPYFPIPIFTSRSNWPVLNTATFKGLRKPVRKRVQALLFASLKLKGLNKLLVWIGAKVVLNRMLTNEVMRTMKKELEKRRLLDEQ